MRKITIALLLFMSINSFGQNITKDDIDKEIKPLKTEIVLLKKENSKLKGNVKNLNANLKSLQKLTDTNSMSIKETSNVLRLKISTSETAVNQKLFVVDKSLSKNSFFSIIGIFVFLIITGILFLFLRNRQKTDKTELSYIIQDTKSVLEKESTKLDIQLLDVIEKQKNFVDKLSILEEESTKLEIKLLDVIEKQLKVLDNLNAQDIKIDHSFHKNSANELMRITNYASTLDPKSQEATALLGSLGRLRDYFNSSSYEITDYTGLDFDDRIPMKVKETIYEETLPKGKEIISKTLKPQIKHKGVVIQDAEVITKYNN